MVSRYQSIVSSEHDFRTSGLMVHAFEIAGWINKVIEARKAPFSHTYLAHGLDCVIPVFVVHVDRE